MKTYTDIQNWINQDKKQLNEFVGWSTPEISPIAAPQAVDDVDSSGFYPDKPEVLEKLNAYCHDIANHQYLNPYYSLNTLYRKLMLIGISFDIKKILMTGTQGRIEVPILQYGGRYGALGDPTNFVSSDDGTRVPGGLNLVVTYQKTGGVYTLDASIQQGMMPTAIGFGEAESKRKISESVEHTLGVAKEHGYSGKEERLTGPEAVISPKAHVLTHPSAPKKKLFVFPNGAWRHSFQTGSDHNSLNTHLKKK